MVLFAFFTESSPKVKIKVNIKIKIKKSNQRVENDSFGQSTDVR